MNKGIETLYLMDKDNPLADITVDWSKEEVVDVKYHSDVVSILPFNPNRKPTWKDFQDFLSYRCFDKTNGQSKQILKALDMVVFDPASIIRKNNGRNFDDHQWFKFEGGAKSYADLLFKKRNARI